MDKLTAKQRRFCDEYLVDLNATSAAIRAGYSERTAEQIGYQLLQKTSVQKQIKQRMDDRSKRIELSQDFVINELMAIASVKATDYAHIVEKAAMAEIDGKMVQLYDVNGNPVMYKTVEPVLTEELTDIQKKALSVIKKGRDGFEIKPYDKVRVLELLGRHLGMWSNKDENDIVEQQARIEKVKAETARIKEEDQDTSMRDDGFMDALRNEVKDVWDE